MSQRSNRPLRRKPQVKKNRLNVPKGDPNLRLRKAFPGQPTYQAVVSSDFQKLSTTVTTGLIASVVTINNALITNFAARFPGFEEFRIIRAVMKVTCFSSSNPGRIILFVDDDDNTVPTLQIARNRKYVMFGASDVGKTHQLTYTPHDLQNLNYAQVGTAGVDIGYFKFFTNNTNLGSSIVATDYLDYTVDLTIQFRGFQG
jgi:hypothetical protein